jgi:2-keto-4-pentenoate hydratase/2-oxohepta-3-ene-1,7-dioic acid hydratase in catechol pathway
MNIINFNQQQIGVVVENSIYNITPYLQSRHLCDVARWVKEQEGPALQSKLAQSERLDLHEVHINSPIQSPGKIVAAPINYKAHVLEMQSNGQAFGHIITDIKKAGLFLKASSSLVGPSDGIEQQFLDRRTDHEIELCCVISERCKDVSKANAMNYVLGYCLGLDITLRGPEDRSFRKSIDSYTVLGPWLTLTHQDIDPDHIELHLSVNGQVRQQASTADMVLSLSELIEYASQFYTLEPGDVLMTGTPQGVGPIRPGDVLLAKGTHLGEMQVRVKGAVEHE